MVNICQQFIWNIFYCLYINLLKILILLALLIIKIFLHNKNNGYYIVAILNILYILYIYLTILTWFYTFLNLIFTFCRRWRYVLLFWLSYLHLKVIFWGVQQLIYLCIKSRLKSILTLSSYILFILICNLILFAVFLS